ncbi:MAG: hypothetical protein ACLPUT_17110 [Solirubrobacteraceae bacterium]
MSRIGIVGLCLAAALALAAMLAPAAQAGEYGRCVTAPKEGRKYTGRYTDKVCTMPATEAEREAGKKNRYEWAPGPGPKPGYSSKSTTVVLEGGAGDITCRSSTDVGRITGPKTGEDQLRFSDCTTPTGSCLPGPTETKELETILVDHGELGLSGREPAAGEAWIEYVSKSGPAGVLAEFTCQGILFELTGSISGVVGGNLDVAAKKGTSTFSTHGGEQDLLSTFFNPFTSRLETGPAVIVAVNESKYEEKVEIRA